MSKEKHDVAIRKKDEDDSDDEEEEDDKWNKMFVTSIQKGGYASLKMRYYYISKGSNLLTIFF